MRNSTGKIHLLICILFLASACKNPEGGKNRSAGLTKVEGSQLTYALPSPLTDGTMSVEHALATRRSHRNFADKAISAEDLSQVLWAAYGITDPRPDWPMLRGGFRTAPSAGALYPFEIYAVIGKVDGIEAGVYKYVPEGHKIIQTINKDLREELSGAAYGQPMIKDAPVTVFYSAIYARTTQKYGERGRERYVCMDLGHSAQNIYLQATALNLGACAAGAFSDDKVSELLQLPENEEPLFIMALGHINN